MSGIPKSTRKLFAGNHFSKQVKTYAFLSVSVAAALLVSCSGGGTDVGPGYCIGSLYLEDGSPASYANATLLRHESSEELSRRKPGIGKTAQAEIRQFGLTVDNKGHISIDGAIIPDGWYQLIGQKGVLKSHKDSIFFDNGICDPVYDTLKETGSLTGKIKLEYGDNPTSTGIYFFGLQTQYREVDPEGNFTLDNLAEGKYKLRFDTNLDDYLSYDTVITIYSGIHDTLEYPIALPFEIQITGFSYALDTLMRSVTLSWNSCDSDKVSGYYLTIKEEKSGLAWGQPLARPDSTSITLYMKNSMTASVFALDYKNDKIGYPSADTRITVFDTLDMKTINLTEDTVRSIGWTVINDTFYVLRTYFYNPSQVSISVYDRNGKQVNQYDLSGLVSEPLAIAAREDSLFLLDRKNSDTLCLVNFNSDGLLDCTMNLPIPELPVKYGEGLHFEFGTDGMIYISQWMTIYTISRDGLVLSVKNGVSSHFATSDDGLFCIVEDMSNIESGVERSTDLLLPPVDNKIIRFVTTEDGTLDSTSEIEYDIYRIAKETPRLFAANNKGIICCLADESLFAFSENGTFKTRRVYLAQAMAVIDMYLMENNLLYLLYERGRIDIVNLEGRIVINQNGRIVKNP